MDIRERKFIAKKVHPSGEEVELELTHAQVSEMMLSGGFMTMLNRMPVGEKLYYNEKKIEFKRIE